LDELYQYGRDEILEIAVKLGLNNPALVVGQWTDLIVAIAHKSKFCRFQDSAPAKFWPTFLNEKICLGNQK
jgi:hypothetical protein